MKNCKARQVDEAAQKVASAEPSNHPCCRWRDRAQLGVEPRGHGDSEGCSLCWPFPCRARRTSFTSCSASSLARALWVSPSSHSTDWGSKEACHEDHVSDYMEKSRLEEKPRKWDDRSCLTEWRRQRDHVVKCHA